MTDDPKKDETSNGETASRLRRLLKTLGRPLAAALLGIILGALCTSLPESLQSPCEVFSRVVPAACGIEDSK